MDALEVQEETGLDFASLNHGCMHARDMMDTQQSYLQQQRY